MNSQQGFPLPDDWHQMAPTLGMTEATFHYQVSTHVIYRWEKFSGVRCLRLPGGRSRPEDRRKPGARAPGVRKTQYANESWLAQAGIDPALYRLAMRFGR